MTRMSPKKSHRKAKRKRRRPRRLRRKKRMRKKKTRAKAMTPRRIRLSEFARLEKEQAEKHKLHNELESLAFEAKNLLDEEEIVGYISEDEKEKMLKEASETRDWLEETPEKDLTFDELKKRLSTLKDLIRPIKKRVKEAKELPKSLDNLNKLIESSSALIQMGLNPKDAEKPLFNKNDSETFNGKLEKLKSWLKEQQAVQEKKKKHENPALTVNQIEGKIKALDKEIKSFMKKMRSDRIVEMNEDDLKSGDAEKKLKEKVEEVQEKTRKKKEDTNGTEKKESDDASAKKSEL
ncbi:hypothetical protein WR25_02058 [Diploscapter pachys]|uniref:Hypoxia up-regulated protein 1 n=1 Tax=Diploscapter pachys TaxID=2018661 RepID=A0A2A2LLH8_9BILA|nr:hypothetical protein WR25_02058 [Diploscapter pachys]